MAWFLQYQEYYNPGYPSEKISSVEIPLRLNKINERKEALKEVEKEINGMALSMSSNFQNSDFYLIWREPLFKKAPLK